MIHGGVNDDSMPYNCWDITASHIVGGKFVDRVDTVFEPTEHIKISVGVNLERCDIETTGKLDMLPLF